MISPPKLAVRTKIEADWISCAHSIYLSFASIKSIHPYYATDSNFVVQINFVLRLNIEWLAQGYIKHSIWPNLTSTSTVVK